MAKRSRHSKGRFSGNGFFDNRFFDTVRDRPLATAAVAVGATGAVAAGTLLWTRRGRISEAFGHGMDRLSELKAGLATQ